MIDFEVDSLTSWKLLWILAYEPIVDETRSHLKTSCIYNECLLFSNILRRNNDARREVFYLINRYEMSGAIVQRTSMSEMNVQWLTYHFNIEHMLHVALEQLHHIETVDEDIDLVKTYLAQLTLRPGLFQNDSTSFTDYSVLPTRDDRKFQHVFHLTLSLWALLIIWSLPHIWNHSFSFG